MQTPQLPHPPFEISIGKKIFLFRNIVFEFVYNRIPNFCVFFSLFFIFKYVWLALPAGKECRRFFLSRFISLIKVDCFSGNFVLTFNVAEQTSSNRPARLALNIYQTSAPLFGKLEKKNQQSRWSGVSGDITITFIEPSWMNKYDNNKLIWAMMITNCVWQKRSTSLNNSQRRKLSWFYVNDKANISILVFQCIRNVLLFLTHFCVQNIYEFIKCWCYYIFLFKVIIKHWKLLRRYLRKSLLACRYSFD